MEKELKAYKDLDVRRSPTTPDSIYFVLNSTTQKITEIWITSNQNIPKKVELSSVQVQDLISSQAGNLLSLGIDRKLYVNSTSEVKIKGETPTGVLNGVNAVFTIVNNLKPNSEEVYINGNRQKKPDDYNITGQTLNLTFSPQTTETIIIDYIKQ